MKYYPGHDIKSLAVMAGGLTVALYPASALASGVTAGTLIQNTASATYTVGGVNDTAQSNTVTVRVDELLNVAVSGQHGSPVTLGSTSAVLAWSVTNTGNGDEAFDLTVNAAVSGNAFDAVVQSVAVDTNGNGVYDPGVDQILASGSPTPSIAPDASLTVFVIVDAPGGVSDGDASQVRLTADADTGTGSAGTTFAGQGTGGGDAVVGTTGASGNALESLIATLVTVTLNKAASVADPFGGTQPVPGAVITYTLTAAVSGTGQADNLHVIDVIPAGTTYQTGTLTLDAGALTDSNDLDAGTASAAGIDVNLGNVTAGTTRTVTFDVRIN